MARLVFWIIAFVTLSIVPILVDSNNEEIPQQKPNDDKTSYSSNNIMELIMYPRDSNARCDSEIKVCGTDMCIDIGSQSSIRDTNKKQVSHQDMKCFCSNVNAVLLVTQDVMEVAGKHVVEYRVQEVTPSGCRAAACNWKLTVFTGIPNQYGRNPGVIKCINSNRCTYDRNPDVIECISSNTCTVACDVRKSKLLQDAYYFPFLALMASLTVVSVVLYITLKLYMRILPQQAENQPYLYANEPYNLMGEEEDIRHYSLMHDRFPARPHVRPWMPPRRRRW